MWAVFNFGLDAMHSLTCALMETSNVKQDQDDEQEEEETDEKEKDKKKW